MTFEDALLEAHETGWYLYALHQESSLSEWSCILRALSGPARRAISRGSGSCPVLAIYDALGSAPELEEEARLSDLPTADAGPRALDRYLQPKQVLRRI